MKAAAAKYMEEEARVKADKEEKMTKFRDSVSDAAARTIQQMYYVFSVSSLTLSVQEGVPSVGAQPVFRGQSAKPTRNIFTATIMNNTTLARIPWDSSKPLVRRIYPTPMDFCRAHMFECFSPASVY